MTEDLPENSSNACGCGKDRQPEADKEGNLVLGYDNPRSLRIKCEYVKENGLKGAMYWDYDGDNAEGDLRRTVAESILGN